MAHSKFLIHLLGGDLDAQAHTPEEIHSLNITRMILAEDWSGVLASSSVLPKQPLLRAIVVSHRAAVFIQQGELDSALKLLRQLTRLTHRGVRSYVLRLLGGALTLKGDLREAKEHLEQALATPVEVERYRTHRDLGVLLARSGEYAEAESHYLKALPGLHGASKALVLNNLAYLQVRRLAALEALTHLEEALKLPAPKSEQARLWRTRHTAHLLRGEAAQAA